MSLSTFAKNYVRKRASARMDDSCRIWKPAPPALNRTTGKTTRSEAVLRYNGPCRVWEVPGGSQVLLGDQQVVYSQTYLSLPWDAPVPESDDVIQVLASDDTSLIGRTLKVTSITRGGGLRASRVFSVQFVDSQKDTW